MGSQKWFEQCRQPYHKHETNWIGVTRQSGATGLFNDWSIGKKIEEIEQCVEIIEKIVTACCYRKKKSEDRSMRWSICLTSEGRSETNYTR